MFAPPCMGATGWYCDWFQKVEPIHAVSIL